MKIFEVLDGIIGRNRIWYHGMSPAKYQKMVSSGQLKPHEDTEHGKGLRFTTDYSKAKSFGSSVVGLSHKDFLRLNHKRKSGFAYGFGPKLGNKPKNWDGIVLDTIPTNKLIKK